MKLSIDDDGIAMADCRRRFIEHGADGHRVTNSPTHRAAVDLQWFPVSLNQQRLWVVDQLHPGTTAYHVPVSLRLKGPLALDALERSFRAIVARHESLRTTFGMQDGAPMQLVRSSGAIPLQVQDITAHPGADLEAYAYSLARQEIQKPFDLRNGPLIRAALLRLAPQDHILVATMHHIVSDGWSAELFISELAQHYEAFSDDREPFLKALPMRYSDFTVLQRHHIASERIEQQLSFWKRTLSGAPSLHEFPCDRARPEKPTFAGASRTVQLDSELVADLQQFARRQRTTFFMLLTAAFQVLISKYSRQHDILIGIPVSGRNILETETLIGLFVNTIVLRASFSEDHSFIEVLRQVRQNLLDAMSHQDVPFELVVDTLRPHRSPSHNPLFQIMFATFRAAVQSREFGNLTSIPYVVETNTSKFDLSVNVIEGLEGSWWLQAEYSTELFHHARIAGLLEAYRLLLRSILTDSRQRISDLQISNDAGEVSDSTWLPTTAAASTEAIAGSSGNLMATSGLDRARRNTASAKDGRLAIQLDHIERTLIEIWQRVLMTSPIGVDDDFFEFGGNSLLAIALIAEVKRIFDRRIPVSTLFRDRTIRRMSKRLLERKMVKSSFAPLVETAERAPLFAAGSTLPFRELSRAFGRDQPFFQMDIFALQEEKMIAEEPLLMTIEDIASHFIREITAVQPSGPYFLAGQCEGGIVALEIARQLERHGQQIATLMQFDTPVTGYFQSVAWSRRVLAEFRRGEIPVRLIRSMARRIRTIFGPKKTITDEEARMEYIWNVIWSAVWAYRSERLLDAEITLFRARKLIRTAEDVATGWDRTGTVRILDVPGDHVSLFGDPGAQATIRHVLEAAYRRGAG
jgi:thioesterase domain-containing protein